MAKPNYAFEKRQKELARKKKKEEKKLQRTDTSEKASADVSGDAVQTGPDCG